jgi:hypothetical protein
MHQTAKRPGPRYSEKFVRSCDEPFLGHLEAETSWKKLLHTICVNKCYLRMKYLGKRELLQQLSPSAGRRPPASGIDQNI